MNLVNSAISVKPLVDRPILHVSDSPMLEGNVNGPSLIRVPAWVERPFRRIGVKIVKLDHVQLAIPRGREEDARRFWGGVLGMNEVPKPEALAQRGDVGLNWPVRPFMWGWKMSFGRRKRGIPLLPWRT